MPLDLSPAAVSSDVLHISTKFDESVHEYQFARSHPQLFAQLQQLTAAKYPLTPLYIHYVDEDGDMVRVTNEAELREAVRVCGSRLNLVLSSGLPSSSSPSAPQQHSIASPTLVSHTPSPSPSLASASPLKASSLNGSASEQDIADIDDYLSSDEEELFEQARSQARSQHAQSPMAGAQARVDSEAEVSSPRYGVVALDSEDEEEEQEIKTEPSTPVASSSQLQDSMTTATVEEQALLHTPLPTLEASVAPKVVPTERKDEVKEQHVAMEAGQDITNVDLRKLTMEEMDAALQKLGVSADEVSKLLRWDRVRTIARLSAQQTSVTAVESTQAHTEEHQTGSISQPAASAPESKVEEKSEHEDGVEAINARLRSFYQLDQQRQAVVSSATTDADSTPVTPMRSPSPVPVASLFTSFFAEAEVIATIRDNAALLTPLMTSSSFPVFMHHLCLLNPALSSHPLTRYTFAVSSLHPFTVCAHCSASPVIGRLLYCRDCDATLCGTCQQQGQHLADHQLTELSLPEYRREPNLAISPIASIGASSISSGSSPRVDDDGRVLEERKASDFAELGDRMRASGQRVWKQGAVSLRKVDEMLTQFAADIKRMIESMLDGVFTDAPHNNKAAPQQPQQQPFDEQKQQPVASPRSRQQQSASGCNVRRPQCLAPSRPVVAPVAPAVDAREAGIALAQPVRQNMSAAEPPRVQQQQAQPSQQQRPASSFEYRAQLDVMNDMGLIRSQVEEETCKELLTASKGNIEQAVQWLCDKINV